MGEATDLVRLAFERFNEGDVDGVVELCSPRIRFQDVPEIPGSRLYEGPEQVREWAEGVRDISEDLRFTFWEVEERGDAVLAETSADMTGARSGAEVGWRFWTVWRVREGLITYHHGYSEREAALEDFEGTEPG
jgi:ketosteroid isomerase-like protein